MLGAGGVEPGNYAYAARLPRWPWHCEEAVEQLNAVLQGQSFHGNQILQLLKSSWAKGEGLDADRLPALACPRCISHPPLPTAFTQLLQSHAQHCPNHDKLVMLHSRGFLET